MAIFGPNEYFNVEMGEGKLPDHIRGIVCDVKNCAYHDGDSASRWARASQTARGRRRARHLSRKISDHEETGGEHISAGHFCAAYARGGAEVIYCSRGGR